MSISQCQYYEAKVFLKALIDAHQTLDEITKQQAQVDKLKFYESTLVSSAKNGQIRIAGQTVSKGQKFSGGKVSQISNFVQYFMNTRLKNFDQINSINSLTSALQNGSI